MRSMAARSSRAEQVRNDACGWLGARQARPPPPLPPVAQETDCQAVMVPSFFAATLILANADGRLPAIFSSVARSRNIFTGLPPLALESSPACTPQLSAANLLPKPPPMYCIWT